MRSQLNNKLQAKSSCPDLTSSAAPILRVLTTLQAFQFSQLEQSHFCASISPKMYSTSTLDRKTLITSHSRMPSSQVVRTSTLALEFMQEVTNLILLSLTYSIQLSKNITDIKRQISIKLREILNSMRQTFHQMRLL